MPCHRRSGTGRHLRARRPSETKAKTQDMTTAAQQNQLVALFRDATVIPVLTIERIQDAVPLARALVAGGVRTLEVTLRTPVAIEAARAMMAEVPEAAVGIGTILNPADFTRVEKLGVRFGISPGLTPDLLKAAADSALPFAPGIATASELMMALTHGFDVAKFFPAEQAGGIKGLRALGGPFPNVRFCPTGGVGEANAATWLAEPNVVAVGGSWLCPTAEIRAGNWAGITAICQRTLKALKGA
ncbi:bifunctional 4-hydroxy-2-oxoglutarate aldolase/2-dehydro-3-deoxy-phosphogluconate aldolase [Bradyrhizobium cajani]|uniref:2-dehydro-3-deoxy-phosphogluconate aldolase n=2 Tax=Bradyrhizobium cajani TaxID=1928661 RepID=A0A844TAY4_9BRAD|nr:bifunctional 4-hydroxy-2-oxoglutarate aldolase/2-dehydro-3-deoxy-phosphogluconate aldolase [Bradyrhizobium cajani]